MAEINVPPSETVPYHLKSTLIFLLFYCVKGENAKKGGREAKREKQVGTGGGREKCALTANMVCIYRCTLTGRH